MLRSRRARMIQNGASPEFRGRQRPKLNTEVISRAWNSTGGGNSVDTLIEKVDSCAQELSRWNREEFGNVGVEIKKLEEVLKGQRDACSRRDTLVKIREWRRKEEMLWWQQSKHEESLNFVQGLEDAIESNVHVLLECPLAERIWSATSVDKGIWGGWFRTVRDCVECAANRFGREELGEFIAIL
ncbi:hypothetical protein Cgig2_010009 [Carnegiea gigantea]|uniref:Uncharacterized protein n=1 Tax=Carnegiea gigantea TaxID=171969 RepID=A0A9Q1JQE4_9CARY|nr:hypothetical protein Cgig2_010009 [Carnegiea gigantea]